MEKQNSPTVTLREKIIGRLREQKILLDLVNSEKAEFIAVYGRLRIGKTYLITNLMRSLPCVFFHATGMQRSSSQAQREEFAKQIGIAFYQGAPITPRARWKDAFEDLTQAMGKIPQDTKIVLFFDEFPWMVTPRSKLLTFLELYWNRYWVFDRRIKLIISGSATSWMMENIINSSGGLYKRVTRSLCLQPFLLHEVEDLLKQNQLSLNRKQILDLYMVLGGVPLYWSFVARGKSPQQCIEELCFQKEGRLVKEFKELFHSLFEDAQPYTKLMRTISQHRYGIGQAELIAKSELSDGGRTVRRLEQLEEAGFITRLIPYGHKEKGVYYVIEDEYSLFYLSWIEPQLHAMNKNLLKEGHWLSQSTHPTWQSWAGLSFASVCYKHILQMVQALDIDPGAIADTWRYAPKSTDQEGVQIALLFDHPDGTLTICEIKYSDDLFAIDKGYAQDLLRKIEVFQKRTKTKRPIFLSIISVSGLKPTMYSEEIITSQATLEDLFKEEENCIL